MVRIFKIQPLKSVSTSNPLTRVERYIEQANRPPANSNAIERNIRFIHFVNDTVDRYVGQYTQELCKNIR